MDNLQQREEQVWNGKEEDEGPVFATKEDAPASAEQYIDHNFKFWDVCQRGGHDFIERQDLPPQCAVCGTIYSQAYKDEFAKRGAKGHLYGGAGWRSPSVKRSRKALKRCSDAPFEQSTITRQGQSSENQNTAFKAWCKAEEGPPLALILLCHLGWPIFKLLSHHHFWRPLTSAHDYGRWSSSYYGTYGGWHGEECLLCGKTRTRER